MTQEEIKKACNAMFTGGTFKMETSRGFAIAVCSNRIFVDDIAVARVNGNRLHVRMVHNHDETTMNLLNALPNVTIERDCGVYKLNGVVWDGEWRSVIDDLDKTKDDL